MADDFVARIRAELDASQFNAQIDDLCNKKYKLNVDSNEATNGVKKVDTAVKNATKTTQSFGQTIKNAMGIGSAAAITAKSIGLIRDAANAAKDAVKGYDEAITDLRISTGKSYETAETLVKGYNKLGKALGATTSEVTTAANKWIRQGNSIADTNKLIYDAMVLSKAGGLDSAEATEYLTSAMKGYKVAVEDVMGIVDKLTAIDLVSATDSGGLAQAMARTAESANLAGISMDKLLGYIATVGEVTQRNMSTVGESFKTIFARMADIKSEKLQFIDEDGTVETLSDVETVLNNLGIRLRDSDNEFRNFGAVLDEVAAGWNNYSSVQQAAISKAFAGTRQAENFKVLMENYAKSQQYLEVAANSTGTAEKKFGAYLDSIEAKTKSLQAAFESLANNTLSTDLFAGILDATTGLVQFLDTTNLLKGALAGLATVGAIKLFTSLGAAVVSASAKMNTFNAALKMVKAGNLGEAEIGQLAIMTSNLSQAQLKAVLSSSALSTEQRMAILTAQGLSTSEAQAALAAMGLSTAEAGATTTTFSLTGAIKGLWATLASNPLILIAAAITAVVSVYSSVKQKAEEAQQAALDAGKAAQDEIKSITDAYNAYINAQSAYESNTGSKEDLQTATDNLLSSLGLEAAQIEKLKEQYGDLDDVIQNLTIDKLNERLNELTSGYKAAIDKLIDSADGNFFGGDIGILSGGNEKLGTAFTDVLEEAGLISKGSNGNKGGFSFVMGNNGAVESLEDVVAIYEEIIAMQNALEQGITDGKYTREQLADSGIWKTLGDAMNKIKENYADAMSYIDGINEASAQIQIMTWEKDNPIPKTASEFKAFREAMIDAAIASGSFVGTQDQIRDSVINTIDSMAEFSSVSDKYADVMKVMEDYQAHKTEHGYGRKTGQQISDFNSWIDGLSDEELEIVCQIRLNTETADWELEDWKNAVENYEPPEIPVEDIPKVSFSDIITDEGFSERIDSYVDDVGELTEAIQDLKDGKLEDGDIVKLMQDFPELAAYGDDLETGLTNILNAVNTDINSFFDNTKLSMASEEDIKALENFRQALIALGVVEADVSTFSFDSMFGGDNGFIEDVDEYCDKMKDLQDALKDIRSGKFTESDLVNLVEEFPSLATQTDNLDAAIVTLIGTMNTDVTSKFAEQMGKMETDDDVAALEAFKNAVLALGIVVEETPDLSFEGIFKGGEGSFIEQVDDYISGVGKLKDALEDIKNGDMTQEGMVALIRQFPTLALYTNDLETGINTLLESMNADMLSAFTEQLGSMSTDDDVTALTNLQEAVLALGNATETETPKISSFAGLFSDDGTDFSRDVDDYISDVETLMNAQKSLQEGTFDSADIANLVTDFPELAGQTDNLEAAITNLLDTMETDMISQFNEQIANMETDADVTALTNLLNVLKDLRKVIEEPAPSNFAELITGDTDFTKSIDDYQEKIGDLQDALKDIRSGEFDDADLASLIEEFPSLANETDNLDAAIVTLIGDMNADMTAGFNAQFGNLTTDEDIEALNNYMAAVLAAGNIVEENSDITFEGLMDNEDFIKDVDSYVDGVNKLQNALDALREGKLDDNDLYDLIKSFPSLAGETDNLEAAITALIASMNTGIMDEFNAQLANIDSSEGQAQLQALLQVILKLGDTAQTTGETITTFFGLFGNGETDFSKSVNDYLDDVGSLQTALEKLRKGELNDTEKAKLFMQFPELAADANNLESAIVSLIGSMESDILTQFEATMGNMETDADVAALQNLENAIISVSDTSVQAEEKIHTFNGLFTETNDFMDGVDKYADSMSKLQDALTKFQTGDLSKSDIFELAKEFPSLVGHTEDLDTAIQALMETMNADMVSSFNEQFGELTTAEDRAQLLDFMDVVMSLGQVVDDTTFSITIDAEETGMQNLCSAIKESVSAAGLSAESIKALKDRYQDLAGYDPAKLFEKTANGVHLNTSALRELENAYNKQNTDTINNQLDDLIKQYNDLTAEIDRAGTAANTADLYAQRAAILNQINDTAELAAQYQGLTSAYYAWEQAQSMGEEGDMYDNLAGSLENVKGLYEDGLIGTNKFRTAVQLMSNEDLSNATPEQLMEAYEKGYPLMQRYFQEGSDGVLNFLKDVEGLNSEWAHMNEDGSWDLNFGEGNDQAVADALGISVDAVQAVLRKLSDYGFDINLDSAYSDLATMQTKAESAAAALKEMGKTKVDFDFDSTNVDRIKEQITSATELLDQFKDENGEINLELEGAQEAQYVLATLIYQRQELEKPYIMTIDTSNISGSMGETLRQIQAIQTAANNLEVQTAIGADTSQAEADLASAISALEGQDAEILASLGIDTTSQATVLSTIEAIKPEVLVSCGIDEASLSTVQESANVEGTVSYTVDSAAVIAFESAPHTSNGKVTWTNDARAVASYASTTKNAKGVVNWSNNTSSVKTSFTATGTVKWKNATLAMGTANAKGTALAQGTAYKRGSWGTKEDGVALGGEVGVELLIRDGMFQTIGDNGAEFFSYKKGDIIFNAAQTEELFRLGHVISNGGRGRAYAEGTAFSSGSGTLYSSGKVKTKPSKTTTSSKVSSSSKGNTTSKTKKDDKEKIDWIEVAIARIETAIERLGIIADSTFKTIVKRMNATYEEIAETNDEILIQQKAYNKYMQAADAVGLSDSIKALVRTGAIDISEYTKETAELIKEYQELYEKAEDAATAVAELHEQLAELYKANFDAIATEYSNQIGLLEHLSNTYTNALDLIAAEGLMGGGELYNSLISVQRQSKADLQKELDDLTQAMSDAINSGEIDEYSEAWFNMQAEINAAKEAIQQCDIAIADYGKSLRELNWSCFDYALERIGRITKESEFLIDLLDNEDLFNEQGMFNDRGNSVMGLHAINYDTYMDEADKYAEQIQAINKEIENDPYDTALIERREALIDLQQQAIKAAESEKDAITSLVEEGIKAELASIKELISAYTDSMESARSLYDYQKKVKKQAGEITSLEKQLAAYSGDTSEENRARLQKLTVDLNSAKEDLQETQYEQYVKDQKKLLDDLYTNYETVLNARLDDVDGLISSVIDSTNANADTIKETIETVSEDVGYTITHEFSSVFAGSNDLVAKYGDSFDSKLTNIHATIQNIESYFAKLVNAGDDVAAATTASATPTTATVKPEQTAQPQPATPATPAPTTPEPAKEEVKPTEDKKKIQIVNGNWYIRKGAGTSYGSVAVARKGETYEYGGSSSGNWNSIIYKGTKRWVSKKGSKLVGYSHGGFIADMQQIAMQNGDDMITMNTLKKGEAILTPEQAQQFKKLTARLPQLQGIVDTTEYLSKLSHNDSVNDTTSIGEIAYNINIPIEHVQDYNDLVAQMQHDGRFEKLIQSMTVDRIVGGSRLAKYKQKF